MHKESQLLTLPRPAREGVHTAIQPHMLVHRDLCVRPPQYAIVDRPTATADRIGMLARTKLGRAVEASGKVAALLEAGVDAFHELPTDLVGETMTLEDHRVVIVERFDEVHV